MASPTTEVFIFESSAAFDNNPDLVVPALKLALAEDGVHSPAFYGKQIENPGMGLIFLNWESKEAHRRVIASPSYKVIGQALKPSLGGKANIYHVVFQDLTVALEEPVTELLVLYLKAPENRAAVVEILTKVSDASDKTIVFGQTLEDENKYVLVGGWPSVEAHSEAVAKPELKTAFDKMYSLANKEELFHAELSQYTKL